MRDDKLHLCFDRPTTLDMMRLRALYQQRSSPPSAAKLLAGRLALLTSKRWPNGQRLRCRFLDGPSSVQQRVEQHARRWSEYANVTFDFVESADAEIRISFVADPGSWSYLAKDALSISPDQPTMNFGWLDESTDDAEYERVVLHEFGHALGCPHEHSSPAGGMHWNRDAVIKAFSGPPNSWTVQDIETQIFYRYGASQTLFSQLDPNSIMMYSFPAELMSDGTAIRGGNTLTQTDIDFISRWYPKTPVQSTILAVNGLAANADIGAPGEHDVFQFQIPQDGNYTVETSGTTDVVLVVTGPNDAGHVVGQDDDSGQGLNARLRTHLARGLYQATVHHYSPRGTGRYAIGVRRS